MCVYISSAKSQYDALKHTARYQNITFQLSIWNGLRNKIQNLGEAHHG